MVPRHPFNEIKPNSNAAAKELKATLPNFPNFDWLA
jgi:hypothetical protein